MTVYSFSQLQQLWITNGGDPQFAPLAAAVSMAESGGRTDAVSPMNSNGTHDYGLWQISLRGGDGGMLDANSNAKRAIAMSNNGKNWKPWCTAYADGACGTKGGAYLGSGSPFWRFLKGTGATVPTGPAFNGGTTNPTVTPASSKDDNPCLFSLPSLGPIGGGCLLKQSQGRAILGSLLMAGGVVIGLAGAALLANKLTGGAVPKMALMAAAPEAAPAIAGASGGKRKVPEPLSSQDIGDLNTEMVAKRQASEPKSEARKEFDRNRSHRRRVTKLDANGVQEPATSDF